MKTSLKLSIGALAVAGAFASTAAHAAGFMLTEQTAGSMGRAYAGVGVDGTDVGGMYYNPATMTLHPGTQIQAGFVGIGLNLDFASDDGTADANGRRKSQAIPFGYISHQINDTTWIGLAMTVPFGMGTDYESDWAYADRGISATILTFDFNPNFAWKVSEKFSVGAGVSIQYAKADLKQRTSLEMVNMPNSSVESEIDADSWACGFNFGVMWSPLDNLRFGLSYRSQIEHDAEGDLNLSDPALDPSDIANLGGYADTLLPALQGMTAMTHNGYATVTAPAWAMATAAWDVNDLLSLYATFRWTDWSSFDQLDITSDTQLLTGEKLGSQIENKWKDTYLLALGSDLRLTDRWTIRGGVAYETSPLRDVKYRTSIIPDADRWWFACGASYKFTENFQWDVSFAHLHGVHERNLQDSDGNKVGRYRHLDAYLLGTQFVYKF